MRVDSSDYTRLAMLARLEDNSPAGQARQALDAYVERRLADPALLEQIDTAKRRYDSTLAVLTSEVSDSAPARTPTVFNASNSVQLTLRIDATGYSRLSALSLVDDDTLADQLRRAIFEMLEAAWRDDWLQMRLRRMRADLNEVFDDSDEDAPEASETERLERVSEAEIAGNPSTPRAPLHEDELVARYGDLR